MLYVIDDEALESRRNIISLGCLRHVEIYKYLVKSHYGLLAYNRIFFHEYTNLIRAYMFSHVGVIPVITSTFKNMINDLRDYAIVVPADDFASHLIRTLNSLIKDFNYEEFLYKREKLIDYAHKNLVGEKQEPQILDVVKMV